MSRGNIKARTAALLNEAEELRRLTEEKHNPLVDSVESIYTYIVFRQASNLVSILLYLTAQQKYGRLQIRHEHLDYLEAILESIYANL